MVTIGITGGYATGKTTVAKMFRQLGAKVVDADRIARDIVKPETLAWRKVVSCFGKEIVRKNGLMNRKKLAGIVFSDAPKRHKLNRLLHPSIISEIKRIIKNTAKNSKIKVLVIDAPLLFEAGIEKLFNKIIVVTCSGNVQQKRAKRRARLDTEQIVRRIQSQWPLEKKLKKADFVISNSGSISETRKQVRRIWRKLILY